MVLLVSGRGQMPWVTWLSSVCRVKLLTSVVSAVWPVCFVLLPYGSKMEPGVVRGVGMTVGGGHWARPGPGEELGLGVPLDMSSIFSLCVAGVKRLRLLFITFAQKMLFEGYAETRILALVSGLK